MDVPLSFTWCFGPLFSSRSSSTCYCLFIIDQKFTSSRQIMSVESLDDYKEHTGKSSVRSNGELISSPTPVSNSSHALLFALSSRSSSLPLPSRSMIENGIMVLRMNIFLNLTAVWKHYLLRSIPIIHRAVPIPAISSIIESVNGSSTELLTGKISVAAHIIFTDNSVRWNCILVFGFSEQDFAFGNSYMVDRFLSFEQSACSYFVWYSKVRFWSTYNINMDIIWH